MVYNAVVVQQLSDLVPFYQAGKGLQRLLSVNNQLFIIHMTLVDTIFPLIIIRRRQTYTDAYRAACVHQYV